MFSALYASLEMCVNARSASDLTGSSFFWTAGLHPRATSGISRKSMRGDLMSTSRLSCGGRTLYKLRRWGLHILSDPQTQRNGFCVSVFRNAPSFHQHHTLRLAAGVQQMLRLVKCSVMAMTAMILCAGVSLAQSKGRGGPGNSVLPSSTTTKVVPTRVTPSQSTDGKSTKVIPTKTTEVINTKYTYVIDNKVTQVITGKVTYVIDNKVSQVITTKVVPTQVIINPVSGGF